MRSSSVGPAGESAERSAIVYYVYVNVNLHRPAPFTAARRLAALPRRPPSAAAGIRARRRRSRPAPRRCPPSAAAGARAARRASQELRELRPLVAARPRRGRGARGSRTARSPALAAQDQLDPHPLALAVDARAPAPLGREQALVLVEADRARGQREFVRELGDRSTSARGRRVGAAALAWRRAHRRRTSDARTARNADRSRSSRYHIGLTACRDCPDACRARRIPTPSSTTRSPRRPRRATAIEVAPRHPLAADAAAVRARPHQPVAARGTTTAATLVDCGLRRRRRRARCGNAHFATTLARRADPAHHRHALPPRPPRQRGVARRSASAAASR